MLNLGRIPMRGGFRAGQVFASTTNSPRPACKATYRRTGVGQDASPVDASMTKANPSKKPGIE
jgi:hypothetical protein